ALISRRRIPKCFRDRPGAVTIENHQAQTLWLELVICARHSFGCRPLQKCPGLGVNGPMQEIVAGGIANIEMDGWIEICDFNQVRLAEISAFFGGTALATDQKNRQPSRDETSVPT